MNTLISKTVTTDIVTELVTVEDAKLWLKITFSEDDTIIASLIKAARIYIENLTNYALGQKTIEIIADLDFTESYSLPLPIGSILSFQRWDGSAFVNDSSYYLFRNSLVIDDSGRYKISLTCGFSVMPADFKTDILKLVAWNYQNRGLDFSNENTSLVDFPKLSSDFYKQIVI
jgi:hypothetical protein